MLINKNIFILMLSDNKELEYQNTDLILRPKEYDEMKDLPISIDTLQTFFEMLEFPEFNKDIINDINRLSTFLANLNIEYQNMNINIPNLGKCEELYNKMLKEEEIEIECDKLEVNICRLRDKYLKAIEIQNMYYNMLKNEYDELKEEYHDFIDKIDTINNICDKIKDLQYGNKENISLLSLHNNYTSKKNRLKNDELSFVAEKIKNKNFKKIYFLLNNNYKVSVSKIQEETGIDRKTLKDIIYRLKNQDIITYDVIKDEVAFKR
ncbi:hypothetical protein SLOPH_1670 [Spraguea lophii 42_110]|uniref:TFIIEalpha/SarR/Rpc3 HTH domain-containing protein n=1 Tax=Spraguea lophii (strain 42_110) TaxID=1358809 RepID=S7XHL5_SPRLO|nr:hypothetical protein SLOPH_1670 [Spraguea lophii 42_110]